MDYSEFITLDVITFGVGLKDKCNKAKCNEQLSQAKICIYTLGGQCIKRPFGDDLHILYILMLSPAMTILG